MIIRPKVIVLIDVDNKGVACGCLLLIVIENKERKKKKTMLADTHGTKIMLTVSPGDRLTWSYQSQELSVNDSRFFFVIFRGILKGVCSLKQEISVQKKGRFCYTD